MDELKKAQLLIRVKRKKVPLVEEKLDEIRNVFSVCLIKLSPRETSNPRFLWFSVEPDRRREDITEELLVGKVQGLLCMGIKTRETEVGPHLIIEVISGEERLHNVSAEFGVQEAVKCSLNIVPRQLTYKSQTLYLRGVVGFTSSFRDTDLGHYRGYALRNDGSWEMYDDLRDKVTNIDGNVEINIHLLVYTV